MAYTTIDDPSAHFQTLLYTGNSSTQSVTFSGNSDLQPDFVWTKCRSNASDNFLHDTNRGVHKNIHTNTNETETDNSNGLTAFNSDGFSMGNVGGMNFNNQTYVGWGWKANGATTTTISAGGDIGRETVSQVNTTAGFNICTYTGSGSQTSFGHSLGAVPHWIMIKNRDQNDDWFVWHQDLNNNQGLEINTQSGIGTTNGYMGNEAPTSTFVGLGDGSDTNASGEKYVAYLFSEKQGYSKFSSYIGNANANGPYVYTGFKPAWLMLRNVTNGEDWLIWDVERDEINALGNPMTGRLKANDTIAEVNGNDIDFLANGFKIRTDSGYANQSGAVILYFAFAENPFVSSEGVPTTAR
jgi:hypothetical protein